MNLYETGVSHFWLTPVYFCIGMIGMVDRRHFVTVLYFVWCPNYIIIKTTCLYAKRVIAKLMFIFNVWGGSFQLLRNRIAYFAVLILACAAIFITCSSNALAAGFQRVQVQEVAPIHSHAYAVKKHAKLYTSLSLKHYVTTKHYRKTAWYRQRFAKVSINGRKKIVFELQSANGRYTYWVFHSQVKGIASKSF